MSCKLSDFGEFTGSIGLRGKRRFFPDYTEEDSRPGEDYCMLLLPTSATEEKQRWWNKLFTCGSGNYLKRENGGDSLLSIFGYPVVDERGTSVTTGDYPPLRLSWGIEKYTGDTDPDHHIFYDVDTLGGNSGSPVIG